MMNLRALPNCMQGEQIVLFLRRHWIDLVRIFVMTAVLLVVPVVVGVVMEMMNPEMMLHPFWGPALMVALVAYLLVVLVLTFTELTDYWLDVWIVTTERIINTEQHGLFNRVVSEVYLSQIQDVTSETRGYLATFLTFGNVFVQTAAERERFEFKNIDNPDDVKVAITGLAKTCKTQHKHEGQGHEPAARAEHVAKKESL